MGGHLSLPVSQSFSFMFYKTLPFLPWVGGKRKLTKTLHEKLPSSLDSYYEPFMGGAALHFSLQAPKAYLSDVNPHLVDSYIAIRDSVHAVIAHLAIHKEKHSRDHFYSTRDRLHLLKDKAQKGASLIYLLKTAFGGIYSENKDGRVRMSINKETLHGRRTILDTEALIMASRALQGVSLICASFTQIKPHKNAFFYIDPPYHSTWSDYTKNGFKNAEHIGLSIYCKAIDEVGGNFMQSNSDTPFIRDLYKDFLIEEVYANRSLTPNLKNRGKTKELLIRNYS